MFTPDTDVTPVIFRKFSDGQVIALFPAEPATMSGYEIGSYMHIGQHGAACPSIVNDTKLATPGEYADLKRELESEPYGYKLRVYRRITKQHCAALKAEQRRMRSTG
jgi:hypothetical protein